MKTENCLTRALAQWNENRDTFRLFYNSNHVVSLEHWYDKEEPIKHIDAGPNYMPLERYGSQFFVLSFNLSRRNLKLLGEYFNYINEFENNKIDELFDIDIAEMSINDKAFNNEIYKFIEKGI